LLTLEVPSGATVADVYERLAAGNPDLGAMLGSALPVIRGRTVERGQRLAPGDEVALLAPVSGG
jgi:molybdopterin converting factor small subunit